MAVSILPTFFRLSTKEKSLLNKCNETTAPTIFPELSLRGVTLVRARPSVPSDELNKPGASWAVLTTGTRAWPARPISVKRSAGMTSVPLDGSEDVNSSATMASFPQLPCINGSDICEFTNRLRASTIFPLRSSTSTAWELPIMGTLIFLTSSWSTFWRAAWSPAIAALIFSTRTVSTAALSPMPEISCILRV